jgi:hypothetical protein
MCLMACPRGVLKPKAPKGYAPMVRGVRRRGNTNRRRLYPKPAETARVAEVRASVACACQTEYVGLTEGCTPIEGEGSQRNNIRDGLSDILRTNLGLCTHPWVPGPALAGGFMSKREHDRPAESARGAVERRQLSAACSLRNQSGEAMD